MERCAAQTVEPTGQLQEQTRNTCLNSSGPSLLVSAIIDISHTSAPNGEGKTQKEGVDWVRPDLKRSTGLCNAACASTKTCTQAHSLLAVEECLPSPVSSDCSWPALVVQQRLAAAAHVWSEESPADAIQECAPMTIPPLPVSFTAQGTAMVSLKLQKRLAASVLKVGAACVQWGRGRPCRDFSGEKPPHAAC
eukprot:scaffold41310_cov13-Tisochrysis_lutea.AAC.1